MGIDLSSELLVVLAIIALGIVLTGLFVGLSSWKRRRDEADEIERQRQDRERRRLEREQRLATLAADGWARVEFLAPRERSTPT